MFLFLFTGGIEMAAQQNDMFKQKRERKRVWRRWRKTKEAYNPYLEKKGKNKESARTQRGLKREAKRVQRQQRKELKRIRRKKGIA